MAGVAKLAREKAKKVSLHNRKLRDCRIHYNDTVKQNAKTEDRRELSSIFITEGDSASGTITKCETPRHRRCSRPRKAPQLLRHDPGNCLQKRRVQSPAGRTQHRRGNRRARYNKVIIATDADVDGMHIRLLVITFFLMFFPDLVKKGHVFILQTPPFPCARQNATRRSKTKNARKARPTTPENATHIIATPTRSAKLQLLNSATMQKSHDSRVLVKSTTEFAEFIGPDMRLDPVTLKKTTP